MGLILSILIEVGMQFDASVTVAVKLASNCMPSSISIDRIKPIALKDRSYWIPVVLHALVLPVGTLFVLYVLTQLLKKVGHVPPGVVRKLHRSSKSLHLCSNDKIIIPGPIGVASTHPAHVGLEDRDVVTRSIQLGLVVVPVLKELRLHQFLDMLVNVVHIQPSSSARSSHPWS